MNNSMGLYEIPDVEQEVSIGFLDTVTRNKIPISPCPHTCRCQKLLINSEDQQRHIPCLLPGEGNPFIGQNH